MLNITNELKKKLLAAKSAEEAAELVKTAGQEITAEDAEKLWKEIEARRERDGRELSPDELEAVSGGDADRDWLEDGCAATVEPGSDCYFSNDFCNWVYVTYAHKPVDSIWHIPSQNISAYVEEIRRLKEKYACHTRLPCSDGSLQYAIQWSGGFLGWQ